VMSIRIVLQSSDAWRYVYQDGTSSLIIEEELGSNWNGPTITTNSVGVEQAEFELVRLNALNQGFNKSQRSELCKVLTEASTALIAFLPALNYNSSEAYIQE